MKTVLCAAFGFLPFSALADPALPPFTEAVLPVGQDLFAVAIGPGGPGVEFGSDVPNGGLYRLSLDGTHTEIELSDSKGLRNPTGLVELNGQIVLVDGNQVLSVAPDGEVSWRRSFETEGAFFYDVEALDNETVLVSDFGRGKLVSVSAASGEFQPYLDEVQIPGLARFEIGADGIYGVSWGSDDAWDSALYFISDNERRPRLISSGFGNLESVELVHDAVVVGGYRGHELYPDAKLMQLERDGTVHPLAAGGHTQGVSDIIFDGSSVWLNYFYDADYETLSLNLLGLTE